MARGEFSVYQFFGLQADAAYEEVLRFVDAKTAVDKALSLARSIGAKIGTTQRVIITDGGDETNWEWVFGKGMTFPPEVAGKHP